MGVQPTFVIPSSGEFSKEIEAHGYDYIISNFGAWTTYKGSLTLRIILGFIYYFILELPAYFKLKRKIKKLRPDIIHSNSTTTSMGYRLAKDLKIPHVWHIREYGLLDHGWNHFPSKEKFDKLYTDKLNYSISITDTVYQYHGSPRNGIVVYDGVFDANNVPKLKDEKEPYFLYVGRVIESKGVKDLLNVYIKYLHNVKEPCRLKIAGEGNLVSYINEWKQKNGCSDMIELLGYRKDIPELMSNAKCLIVPSPNEAFGFITAEGMFNGCLVVGKNTAGTKIQFDNCKKYAGRDLAVRYYTDEEMLCALINITLNQIEDIKEILADAQQSVIGIYSTDTSSSAVYNYYNKILGL